MRVRIPRSRVAMTAVAVGVSALTLGLAATASAAPARPTDTGARSGDAVGVGSDTLQNAADFVLDAGANGASGGYNALGGVHRVFNVYATGDANGRATYDGTCGVGTASAPATQCTSANASAAGTAADNRNLLLGTVILRAGSNPVIRPNGSGNGVGALIADAPGGSPNGSASSYEGLTDGSIQFARMSRLPNSTEEGNCPTSSPCAGLHVYQLATDTLQIAHLASGYNGPSGLSLNDLVGIYQCTTTTWSQVSGYSGSAGSATIRPLIPQSGSGTRNFFLADLAAANGGNAIKLGSCVGTVEEHDPDGIYEDTNSANAIEPFSTGKLSLINSGYFTNGNESVGILGATTTNTAFTPGLLTSDPGTAKADGGNSSAYSASRGLYVTLRQEDVAATVSGGAAPFQPGGSQTFAQVLFTSPTSYAARSAQSGDYAAAGFTQAYMDCGINPTSC